MVFLEECFENFDFEKKSADDKKACKITQHAKLNFLYHHDLMNNKNSLCNLSLITPHFFLDELMYFHFFNVQFNKTAMLV